MEKIHKLYIAYAGIVLFTIIAFVIDSSFLMLVSGFAIIGVGVMMREEHSKKRHYEKFKEDQENEKEM